LELGEQNACSSVRSGSLLSFFSSAALRMPSKALPYSGTIINSSSLLYRNLSGLGSNNSSNHNSSSNSSSNNKC
jgi:hypothetical protein